MLDVSADPGKFTHCIRLVIADPQPIVLQGLKSVFAPQHDFEIVASCSCGTSCLEAIRNLAPDVALVANTLPDLTVSEILAIAKAENLPTQLVFFAESEGDDDLAAAMEAGACNAVSKYAHPDTVLRSLRLMTERTSASPKPSQDLSPIGKDVDGAKIEKMLELLTQRERQIVRLVSEGLSNKEIARELNVSRGTVKVHLYNIFQKLDVSNRTVLATIALLQRSTGLSTLSLAALAFAILSDAKASDTSHTFVDDDSAGHKDLEHPLFELWKKAILRQITVMDPGETVVSAQRGSSINVSQVASSAARMEGMHAAEQAVLSNFGRGYGPIGSSTPYLSISPLLQAINSQTGSPTTQQQFPPLEFASKLMKSHGGYGTFTMTAAGAWIYTLENSHAAVQALDPGATLIDTSAVATMDSATQVATITIHGASNVERNDVDSLASGPVVHDSHSPLAFGILGNDSATGEGNAGKIIHGGAGDDTIPGRSGSDTIDGNNGNDTIIGRHGGDQLTGSNGDDTFVYLSATDSNSTQFDTTIDFISEADKINLAAFGALAFLHMTSTSTFVPPHTLAWIYNPATNETIIYINPTDGSLHIGDPGLLEIHLQGVVSVAESDFAYEPEAAAVAAALEGIDPALLVATASDGTVLTAGSADASIEAGASESKLGMASIWTMPADDGLRFHFGRDRIGSMVSTRLTGFGDDSNYGAEERDDGAVMMPVHASSIEPVHIHATVLTDENLTLKKEPVHGNIGAVTIGHGNPHATAGLEPFEFGMQSAAIAAPAAVAENVEPSAEMGNSSGYGNSQHPSQSNSEKAAAAELAESGITSGHGNSEHASHSAAAKAAAADPAESGITSGHGNSEHASNSAAAKAAAAAEPAESGITSGHGNSEHASNSAAAKAPAAAELTEPGITSGNGVGHNNFSSHSASASAMEAAEPIEPGVAAGGGHTNSVQASHAASANPSAASPQPAEPASGIGGAGHESAFHFTNQAPPSTPAAVVELEELNDSPVPLVQGAELAAILEMGPATIGEHATSHVNSGQHHALAHLPHEQLLT